MLSQTNSGYQKDITSDVKTITQADSNNIISHPPALNNNPVESPSQIVSAWSKEIISGSASKKVYRYLIPERRTDYPYEVYEDDVYRMNQQWRLQGVSRFYVDVEDEIIQGDTASAVVVYKFRISSAGYQTTSRRQMNFTKIDNEWKLNDFYDLD